MLFYFSACSLKICWTVSFALLTHSYRRYSLAPLQKWLVYLSYTLHIYTVNHFNVNKEITHQIDLIHSLCKYINGHCTYVPLQYNFTIHFEMCLFFNISTVRHKKKNKLEDVTLTRYHFLKVVTVLFVYSCLLRHPAGTENISIHLELKCHSPFQFVLVCLFAENSRPPWLWAIKPKKSFDP